MLMWFVILGVLIVATAVALFYLGGRLARFGFIAAAARGRNKRAVGVIAAVAVFAVSALTLNLMNAVVCLLHFAVIWGVCDSVFYLVERFRKKTFERYYAGAAAVLLSLAALAAGWHSAHDVSAVSYLIETDKDVKDLRIVMFADSHIGTTFDAKGFAEHVGEMQKYSPDAVVIVGDFVDDGTNRKEMLEASRALSALKTKYGVFFVFGNHDKGYHNPADRGFTGADLTAELKKNGVKVLQDETHPLGETYYIVGRQDASEPLRGGSRAEMRDLVKGLDKSRFTIVLDHQPNDYKKQADAGVDLVLSGHTHGGQLFPLNRVGEWIGANDKTYGYERRKLTDFIVTSGVSDWAIRFKTGTRSEFVVIDVKKK